MAEHFLDALGVGGSSGALVDRQGLTQVARRFGEVAVVEVRPFPSNRRVVIAAMRAGRRKVPMYGLADRSRKYSAIRSLTLPSGRE